MKNFFIVLIMKLFYIGLKILGKNGGNLLGKVAYDWNRNIFKYFKVDCSVIAVTATNGKTMTNNAIGYTLKTAGKKVISNIEGNWYYLDKTEGYMWKNTTTPDGYFVNINGALDEKGTASNAFKPN